VTGSDLADGIAALQEHLRGQPRDARTWASLGVAYVEQARLTGDASYYPKARRALARSVREQARDNDVALAGRAALASARHDFAAALRLADQALAVNPYQSIALSIRIDALTELGRYAEQRLALRIADRRQPGVPVLARWSYAEELRGHDARAADLLRRASSDAVSSADRAYLLTLLADLDRRSGRLEQADASLATALRSVPNYVPALASRARLALARGDLHSAERDWTMATELLPLPEYLIELGELLLHLGRRDEARAQFDVVRATERLLAGHGVNTDLEAALFAADHGDPALALQAARAEWSRRRSIQVADVYAWALHVNGRDGAALRLSRRATRLGTEDGLMLIHRGLIEESVGLRGAARQHLRQGLAADPGLSAWQADHARAAVRRLSSGP
jgi:tetratricopeptide (TPR) repeat protein